MSYASGNIQSQETTEYENIAAYVASLFTRLMVKDLSTKFCNKQATFFTVRDFPVCSGELHGRRHSYGHGIFVVGKLQS